MYKLQNPNKVFKTAFKENIEPIVLVNGDNIVIRSNNRFEEVFGYSEQELKGKNIDDYIVPEELEGEGKELIEKSKEGFSNYKTLRKNKSGEKLPVLISSKKIETENQKLSIATYKVIKELKDKEEKLKKYKLAIEGSMDLISALDTKLNYLFANEKYKKRFGVEEIENKNIREVLPKEEHEEAIEKLKKCLKGEKVHYEMERESIIDGYSHYDIHYYPLREDKEEVEGVVAVLRDITEKKKLERREKILHSILIHDVSNKLQIIKGYLNLLKETELSEEQKNKLNKTINGLMDSENIIKRVKILKEVEKTEPEKYCPREDIKDVIDELNDLAKEKNIKLINELDGEREIVLGGSLIKDLFRNLIRNSIQHSDASKIWIRKKELKNHLVLKVEDNGKGIPKEEKVKITKKGYSSEGNSDGLGLFIVKEIIDAYQGHLGIEDSEEGGASFQVTLKKP